MTVVLTGTDLTVDDVVRVARDGERVALAPEAVERMRSARAVVEGAIERGDPVYGLTTGVASRKRATGSARVPTRRRTSSAPRSSGWRTASRAEPQRCAPSWPSVLSPS